VVAPREEDLVRDERLPPPSEVSPLPLMPNPMPSFPGPEPGPEIGTPTMGEDLTMKNRGEVGTAPPVPELWERK